MTNPVPRAFAMATAVSRPMCRTAIERCRLAHDPQPPGIHSL